MNIPDFTLLQSCGRGAYGEVWLARNTISGRLVALKVVMRSQAGEKELSGLIHCSHLPDAEHIIRILHIGSIEDGFYYTMELADGLFSQGKFIPLTLAERLKHEKQLSVADTVELGKAMADGLKVLHDSGLLHRDVKPENILFVNGKPKLSDVGLVRPVNQNTTLGGTLGFIPPDRLLAGMVSKDASDDLYALGKVLYCAVTGNPVEQYPTFPAEILKSRQGKLLNRVILKACDPGGKRYDSAAAMKEELESIVSSSSRRVYRIKNGKKTLKTVFFLLLFCGVFANLYYLVRRPEGDIRSGEQKEKKTSSLEPFPRLVLNYAGGLTEWRKLAIKKLQNGAFKYTPSSEDPLHNNSRPDELDMAPRRCDCVVALCSPYNSPDWDRSRMTYRPASEAGPPVKEKDPLRSFRTEDDELKIKPKEKFEEGIVTLKKPLPDEFVMRFKIRWLNQGAYFRLRITDGKDPKHYYVWSIIGGTRQPKNSLIEYRPSNFSENIYFDVDSYIGTTEYVAFMRERFVTYEIVRTKQFLRIYAGAHLCTCIPSFFPGGQASIELSQMGNTEISNFELYSIPHDPACPRRLQYQLPIN